MRSLLLAALLLSASGLAQESGEEPRFSDRYTVQIGDRREPLLKWYEKSAKKLDRNRDRVLSPQELAATAKGFPGNLRVDLDDYTVGVAHEWTGTVSSYAAGYPSPEQLDERLRQLQSSHPERVTLVALGTTPEGRTVSAVRIAAKDGVDRPKVAVVAQQHAREWAAHQVSLASMTALLEQPANQDLLEAFEFWFVPLANPDGYEYSLRTEPMWRKNRSGSDQENRGVDLNRNFAADFRREGDSPESVEDDLGASDRPYSSQYRGPSPASEPETQFLQQLLDKPGMVGVVDLHGFGCKIVLPNQGTRVEDGLYLTLAKAMEEALGPDYQTIRYQELYPITGHLAAYADQRGVVGITLEVGQAFQPNPAKLAQLSSVGSDGVMAFARALKLSLQG